MLCSLCQNGVTRTIGNVPTGKIWLCPCGESHCRHIDKCDWCGKTRPSAPAKGDYLGLGGEYHTVIVKCYGMVKANVWLVTNELGEDFQVIRDESQDNETRRAWKLIRNETGHGE